MKGQIFVLKRSNGFCSIYVNGHNQNNLVSNFPLTDKAENLFDRVMQEFKNQAHNYDTICEIIFTDNEESFKSDLPKFYEYLGGLNNGR